MKLIVFLFSGTRIKWTLCKYCVEKYRWVVGFIGSNRQNLHSETQTYFYILNINAMYCGCMTRHISIWRILLLIQYLALQRKSGSSLSLTHSVIDTPQLSVVLAYGHLSYQGIHTLFNDEVEVINIHSVSFKWKPQNVIYSSRSVVQLNKAYSHAL